MPERFMRGIEALNGIVWGPMGLGLLFGTGLLLTVRTGGFQLRRWGYWMRHTLGAILTDRSVTAHTARGEQAISQFQSLCTALASTIGTGNLVGVATAILSGGAGAVFWMWVMALLGMMTSYAENVLGIYYRRKDPAGGWRGGPMYYLRDGLGGKPGRVLAVLTSGFVDLDTGRIAAGAAGSALVGQAFDAVFGTLGSKLIAVCILLFAYSTTLGWSCYGCKAVEYLFGAGAGAGYRVLFVALMPVGAVMRLDLAWTLSDTFNGLMMLPNLIGVIALSGTVVRITQNYLARKLHGSPAPPLLSAGETMRKPF